MKEISEEAKARYFEEVGICLTRGGFQVGPVEDGFMPVFWQEAPLCRVNGVGGIRYRGEVTRDPGTEAALYRALDIVNVTEEYMRLLEKAPQLNATGLVESYKLLNEFNGAVLAAHHSSRGWDFVTWCRDYSGKAVTQGHYVGGDYEGAKRDFAVRAGLVPQRELFSQEQLAEIHRCVETVRDMDPPRPSKGKIAWTESSTRSDGRCLTWTSESDRRRTRTGRSRTNVNGRRRCRRCICRSTFRW